MKISTILDRYLLKEMAPPFIINVGLFTFVFLMTRILDITNLVVNYKIGLLSVCLLLIYSVPFFLVFVIPMSTMMAVLLTFLRMSGDNEIIALKAGGVSIYRFLPAVIGFCLFTCLMTGIMGIYGIPWGKQSIKNLTLEAAGSSLNFALKERTFNDGFDGVMIYMNQIDVQTKALIDVFIEDHRDENIVSAVVAPKGILLSGRDKLSYHLRLHDGIINQVDVKNRSVHSINFDVYDLNLDVKSASVSRSGEVKKQSEMSLTELREFIRTSTKKNEPYYVALIEYHKKFSVPFACLSLGLLALPLGIQARSSKRSYGLGLSLGFFLLYYLMLSAGLIFGEAGAYPPVVGMWVPNVISGCVGIYLLVMAGKEKPVKLPFARQGMKWIRKKLKRQWSL